MPRQSDGGGDVDLTEDVTLEQDLTVKGEVNMGNFFNGQPRVYVHQHGVNGDGSHTHGTMRPCPVQGSLSELI